jgi:hypothetical protein
MSHHSTRVRWVGPLALLLALGALAPRPAAAGVAAPAAAPAAPATASHAGGCLREAVAYATAVNEYIDAWGEYNRAVETGDGGAILAAANKIDRAAMAVASTGLLLVACLIQLL